jgi:beta-glucosidase
MGTVKGFLVGCLVTAGIGVSAWQIHRRRVSRVIVADPIAPVVEPRIAQHLAILARHKRGGVNVLFLGDSITDFWHDVPWIWDKAFGKFDPSNAGIDSDQTQHVLWRVQNGELDGINPKVVVLLVGTNNIAIGHDDASLTALGIGRLGGEVQQRLPGCKLLLLGILPRHDQFAAEAVRCNVILSHLRGDEHLTYFDPGAQLIDADFADGLHLSPAGFEHLSDMLEPKIEALSQ